MCCVKYIEACGCNATQYIKVRLLSNTLASAVFITGAKYEKMGDFHFVCGSREERTRVQALQGRPRRRVSLLLLLRVRREAGRSHAAAV